MPTRPGKRTEPSTTQPAAPLVLPTTAVLGTVQIPVMDGYPASPPKTVELLAAEQQLAALLVERDDYEDLRTAAIEAGDADELLRVQSRHSVLPTLIDAAEVARLDAHIDWIHNHWLPLYACTQQYLEAISDLGAQRRRIDEETNRLAYVLNNLDGRREEVRIEARDMQKHRDEVATKSPAVRRGRLATFLAR